MHAPLTTSWAQIRTGEAMWQLKRWETEFSHETPILSSG
jgi:hypothetical protein